MQFNEHESQLRHVAGTHWHVAVIGAGPAGCVAAAILARAGRRVLLAEKSCWPREKVCGGCVNHAGVAALRDAGLSDALAFGTTIDRVQWRCGRHTISVPTPSGVAVLRSEMDAALAQSAERRGCTFLPGVSATIMPGMGVGASRTVLLRRGERSATIAAEVVLACDGISGTSISTEPWAKWRIARRGWIGASATLNESGDRAQPLQMLPLHRENATLGGYLMAEPPGAICMHVGQGGYVGLVRMADGRVHLAAALDPRRCRQVGGASQAVNAILESAGIVAGQGLEATRLRGTGVMTRRRRALGGHRVLVVGDAAGYVEPFSGQGMAWAIRSAAVVAEEGRILPAPGEAWPADLPKAWEALHSTEIGAQQRACRALRPIVHHPGLSATVMGLGGMLPCASRGLASHVCGVEGILA